jgi:hypothetical protein
MSLPAAQIAGRPRQVKVEPLPAGQSSSARTRARTLTAVTE